MKKFIYILLIMFSIYIPTEVYASVQALDLNDTLQAEDIVPEYSNYEENDKQVVIYLFRGDGCTHCQDFLNYINSIIDEYGYMFKIRSFEVWNNTDNALLKEKIVNFIQPGAKGVPFIIIGKKTFVGYNDDYKILDAIQAEYKANKKYDVFDEIEKNQNTGTEKQEKTGKLMSIIIVFAVSILIFLVLTVIKKRK